MPDGIITVLRVSAGLDPRIGGPYESTVLSVLAADNQGVRSTLVAPSYGAQPEESVKALRDAAIPIRFFPMIAQRWSFSPRLTWWLLQNVNRYDVIHAHGAWTFPTLAAAIFATLSRRSIVLTPHESLTNYDVASSTGAAKLVKIVMRRLYSSSFDAIVFASNVEAADVPARGKAQRLVIAHPVPVRRVTRRESKGNLRVGYLGRLTAKKNIDLLIRSVPRSASLTIAGAGPLERSLRQKASQSHASIDWLGFLTDNERQDFFASIDVLALPSQYECFGMAAAEALAAGLPVLVSRNTGMAELVDRYDCGVVVTPTEVSIRAALTKPVAWWRDKASRAEAASAEFTPERHGRALRVLYENLLKRKERWPA
jgi:glycosyltransferase involved in cell wall biosynthesis